MEDIAFVFHDMDDDFFFSGWACNVPVSQEQIDIFSEAHEGEAKALTRQFEVEEKMKIKEG